MLPGESSPEAAETLFRGLLESAPDGVVIVDVAGLIQIVNRQTEVLFGYPRADLLGRPVEVLMPLRLRDGHVLLRESYTHDPRTRPMGSGLQLFGRRQDGTEFPVEISLSPMTTESGSTLIIGNVRDVTARVAADAQLRAAAAELERSNAELEQFAYVASHDLQEPLRMVTSFTQLLSRRYAGKLDADADEFIGYAVDGSLRMQELINDLLTYSRVGTRALTLQAVDTAELVDQVLGDLSRAIQDAHGTVARGDLPMVRGDLTQLRQLFQNLIANAVKFHRPGVPPEVCVAASPSGGKWQFSVSDNGIGIERQYLERIFVLFQRLHSRAEYPGTGIGLAICKKIVERHGGEIQVRSEFGHGTTFLFTLPSVDH
jgi:PAS domain S-box-containing protein